MRQARPNQATLSSPEVQRAVRRSTSGRRSCADLEAGVEGFLCLCFEMYVTKLDPKKECYWNCGSLFGSLLRNPKGKLRQEAAESTLIMRGCVGDS